jgi:NADP-dependent 3-hydroxy acid dehydrogenase YdfG
MNEQQTTLIKLQGQTAIVTGASSGIGASIAQEMGTAGANVKKELWFQND